MNWVLLDSASTTQLERDSKIGKIAKDAATQQSVEILTALKKLGEQLTAQEEAFLQAHSSTSLRQFEKVSGDIGKYDHMAFGHTLFLYP